MNKCHYQHLFFLGCVLHMEYFWRTLKDLSALRCITGNLEDTDNYMLSDWYYM